MFVLIGIPVYIGIITLMWLSLFRITDSHKGGLEALSFAWNIMRGRLWTMLVYTLLVLTLSSVGIMGMYIGVLVTVPLGIAALACCYDALSRKEPSVPTN